MSWGIVSRASDHSPRVRFLSGGDRGDLDLETIVIALRPTDLLRAATHSRSIMFWTMSATAVPFDLDAPEGSLRPIIRYRHYPAISEEWDSQGSR